MFNRPSLSDLVTRTRNDLLSRLTSDDDALRRTDAEVYAKVISGTANALYAYINWLADQIIFDRCDTDILLRWADIWLQVPRKAAAAATGSVVFTLQAGAAIPSGTLLQALDGVQYITTADATISLPTATAPVVAVIAAAAGNRTTGQNLTLVSPIDGVQAIATAGALSGGADIESFDDLRARLIIRIRQPPQGGAEHDYINWALEVPGVTRAWCFPKEQGRGTVVVRFVRDNDVDIIPDSGAVATVQAYIDARRPVTADFFALAPIASVLNFSIALTPNTTVVQNAVTAELQDLIMREAQPEGGNGEGTILRSHIDESISVAEGETDHVLSVPSADATLTTGHIWTMGIITWL